MSVANDLCFPVLIWRPNYILVAKEPIELCATSKSQVEEERRFAKDGEYRLVDSSGRYATIGDFLPVPPFRGLKALHLRLMGSVFTEPKLTNETTLALSAFKDQLIDAVRLRNFGRDDFLFFERIKVAQTYREAIASIPQTYDPTLD